MEPNTPKKDDELNQDSSQQTNQEEDMTDTSYLDDVAEVTWNHSKAGECFVMPSQRGSNGTKTSSDSSKRTT